MASRPPKPPLPPVGERKLSRLRLLWRFAAAYPWQLVAALAAHRREREARVLEELHRAGRASAEALVPPVYGAALDPRLIPAAARSLTAHLIKLAAEGSVRQEAGEWMVS